MVLLNIFRPLISLIPSISAPNRRISYSEKMYWTFIVLLLYLVFSQMPLYGISLGITDPLHLIRVIMASNRGTLMELGISPSMTASLFMQFFTALGLVAPPSADSSLYEGGSKLVTLLITLFQAIFYVYSGMYGNLSLFSLKSFLIVMQLFFAGFVLLLMDDLLSSNWGFGSGSNLFIACNYCENVLWKAISPITLNTGRFKTFEGSLISLIHLLSVRANKFRALKESIFRKNAPNIAGLFATFVIFCIVVFLQGFKIDLPIQHSKIKGHRSTYAIKLFYTSTMPVILQNSITSNLLFISNILYNRFPNNFFIRLIGKWEGRNAIGGIAYFLSPPDKNNIMKEKIHFLGYALFNIITCGILSRIWVEMSGNSPKDVAKKIER